jgi:hypothetical protein
MRCEANQGGLLLHLDVYAVHWGFFVWLRQCMFICGRRMAELVWRKWLRMLRLHSKWINMMMGTEGVGIEAMEMSDGRILTSVHGANGGG